ncbi:PD-(D/E)XK nuclease family protein [Hymenobacter busanensis]|uniref:PD-(D/E)XK nuclease family protein n=1 Tax=Hymenobacter busanensis TaxID=2607656 RepID=A0A7L4ZT97_9BACT|nr:PD-(D/E)XK nuclease family protein [Hymenobacter busanensis]KAA9327485.1 PD-(D/E)XK nuclease family protein [Hymenobacter busanensis]QHJ06177.1 PD-(D/E)XK nuclease family protein [Hymenobacter busanensis]
MTPHASPAATAVSSDVETTALQPFLRQAAQDLLRRFSGSELSDLVVVVPTRRAVVYLKNELALAAPLGEAVWSPRVAAMEDYMVELAGVQVEEPIALQLLLFDILRELDPKLDFDLFTGWSALLLNDFSALDQNLADPASLFEYLSEAKALERWDLTDQPPTPSVSAWFRFWDDLGNVYTRLRRRLKADALAYPGLAYRLAVDAMQKRLRDAPEQVPQHVFLGLGILSKAERRLLKLLQKERKAEIRFDTDRFYLDGDSPNRAGLPFRRLAESLDLPPTAFGFADTGAEDLLRTLPRTVRQVGVANNSMQGKVAGQLVVESLQRNPGASVAVVLPDETLLLPVLHGLPPEQVPQFNVTMGLSFRSTPLFNLIDLLFEVHLTGVREGETGSDFGVRRYHHLTVTKLLAHPFLRRYESWLDQQPEQAQFHGVLDDICRQIVQRNAVLLSETELRELGRHHPLVEALFRPWRNCDDVVRACYEVIELLRNVYRQEHTAIEAEYLYLFYTLVRQLDSAFDCREHRPSVRSFRRFLYDQMGRTRLPFSGEPIAQVQIMGLLETRALDFDHIIILSCNENILPAPKRNSSLFPYDVLTRYGLPTYADHEAATSHQFWRLLQRARRVDLIHILPGAEGVRTGERSRFLLQIENDLAVQNPHLEVLDLVATTQLPVASSQLPVADGQHNLATGTSPLATQKYEGDLVLEKDAEMRGAIRGVLERGLSASGLNQFLTCSLQFYFSRIAKFKEQDGVEEDLGADVFGTAVHYVLEHLMQPFVAEKRSITADDVLGFKALVPELLERGLALDDGEETDTPRQQLPDEGLNHVLRGVGRHLVQRYLDSLIQQIETDGPLKVVGLEEGLVGDVTVETADGERVAVHLIGFADRVDELPDGRRRIIDYKTGSVHGASLNLMGGSRSKRTPEEAFERLVSEAGGGADKVRQLWLYRLMLAQRGFAAADAAIVPLRSPDPSPLEADLSFLTAGELSFEQASREVLTRFVDRMLDPKEPIRKTDDLNVCQWCPYKGICAR